MKEIDIEAMKQDLELLCQEETFKLEKLNSETFISIASMASDEYM